MVMSYKVSAVIGSTDYGVNGEDRVTVFSVQPAGIGVFGTADVALYKDGGGYTITPMQRVKLGRLDAANKWYPRLLYGVAAHVETTQWPGTVTKEWFVKVQDVNIIGTAIGTPGTFAYPATTGAYGTQIAAIVAAVQGAYGAVTEGIDASTQVVPDPGLGSFTMPALEGGHPLNWYIDAINAKVYELSAGLYAMAYYYGMATDVGVTATFGPPYLVAYDSAGLPSPVATYSTNPGVGERAIRAANFRRQLDATTLYVRRQASYNGGLVTGYNATANTAFPCPWSAGGWWREMDQYDVSTAAEAQARIDADVAANSNPLETISFVAGGAYIHVPGEVIAVTSALEGLSAERYRIVRSRIVFEDSIADLPYTEITAGLLPRGLGRGGTVTPIAPVLRDTVPPVEPATQPTVVSNVYNGGGEGARAVVVLSSVNSISHDVGAHRLRLVVNSAATYYSPWVTAAGPGPTYETTFPPLEVPAGSNVSASVLARDTSGNEATAYGPARVFTAARAPGGPDPPTWTDKHPAAADQTLFLADWTSSVTGDGTRAMSTSQVFQGEESVLLGAQTGTAQLDSVPWAVRPGAVYAVEVTHRALFAVGTLAVTVRWLDKAGAFISSSTVYNTTPVAATTPTSVTVTAPSTATQATWRVVFTGDNATTNGVYIGPPSKWRRLTDTIDATDGFATIAKLAGEVKTDASWPQWNIEAAAFLFKHNSGTAGQFSWNNVSPGALQLTSGGRFTIFGASGIRTATVGGNSTDPILALASSHNAPILNYGAQSSDPGTLAAGDVWWTLASNIIKGYYRDGSTTRPIFNSLLAGSGTSFPGSPLTNQAFFRTDLGWWCFYDGTRWLTCHEIEDNFGLYVNGNAPQWAGTTEVAIATFRGDYSPYLTRWTYKAYLAGTNSISHYWKLYLRNFTALTTIRQVDTIALTGSGAWNPTQDISSGFTQPTGDAMQFYVETSGAPGGLQAYINVWYRLIVT